MTEIAETAKRLAAMFVENTGRHILDSGGGYGRNWERNQGRDVQSFLDEPVARFVNGYQGSWYINVSTFHFLNERLEWDDELNDHFEDLANDYPDDSWFALMDRFPKWYSEHTGEDPDSVEFFTENSYNHESPLDQTIQYAQVSQGGEAIYPDYIILQVHGGCDVRGGYTQPRLFRPTVMSECGLVDDSFLYIGHTKGDCESQWYSDDAGYHWYSEYSDHDPPETMEPDTTKVLCPDCRKELTPWI